MYHNDRNHKMTLILADLIFSPFVLKEMHGQISPKLLGCTIVGLLISRPAPSTTAQRHPLHLPDNRCSMVGLLYGKKNNTWSLEKRGETNNWGICGNQRISIVIINHIIVVISILCRHIIACTFHLDFAKFFFSCSETVPWMFLLLAAFPDILQQRQ